MGHYWSDYTYCHYFNDCINKLEIEVKADMGIELGDILSGGSAESDSSSKYLEILKDLSDEAKIRTFSELSSDEVRILARISTIAMLLKKKYGKEVLSIDNFIHSFMMYRVSKDRRSRGEFIESMNSQKIADTESKMLQRMAGMQKGFVR